MTTLLDPRTIAKRFANALDRCDYADAGRYLAPDCHYQAASEQLIGPEAILASYRENAEWGSRVLEHVIYASSVEKEEAGGSWGVLYSDRITQSGLTHEYHCRQRLMINLEGKIARIVHEELPGERERLDEFLSRCGIRR